MAGIDAKLTIHYPLRSKFQKHLSRNLGKKCLLLTACFISSKNVKCSNDSLTRAKLGSPANLGWLGGLGEEGITPEPRGGARSARGCWKALNEGILIQYYNFLSKVKCLVKVGSKVKADSFRLIGCRDQTKDRCNRKLCKNASEGIAKMPCKYETNAKFRLRSRPG